MTRRVRFTPLSCVRAFVTAGLATAGLLCGQPATAAQVPFAPVAVISTLGIQPDALASADLDRDGDLDLLAGWSGTSRLAWFDNVNGDGSTWTLRTIATDLSGIRSVAAADVDGDGDPDAVAVSAASDAVAWYENTAGNGSAWVGHTISTAVDIAWTVFAADMDHDGDIDVLSANAVTSNGAVYFHENVAGNGTVWTLRTIFVGTAFVSSVAAADIDGDGDLDAVESSLNNTTLAWHENLNGNGTLWVMRTVSAAAQAREVAPADVDHDGDMDLLASFDFADRVNWYENVTGNGQAWTLHTIATAVDGASGLAASDMDRDGDLDAVSVATQSDAVVWHENLDGHAGAWTTHTVGTRGDIPVDLVVADFDGDGDPDVASVAELVPEIAWFRNDSIHQTACFGATNTIFSTDAPFGSAAADIDRDGDLDVFVTSFSGTDTVTWHRNEGGGGAWTTVTVATGHNTFIVNAADIDGDGDSDALLGANPSDPASWAESLVGGSIWSVQAVATPGAVPPALELRGADIDGDGDLDALAPAFNGGLLSWFENQNGLGDLWLQHTVATLAQDRGAQAVDLDRDGDLDILTPASTLVWYQNAGSGMTWTRRTISPADPSAVAALDLDGDGDLDLVASNVSSSPGVLWHENLAGNGTSWAAHSLSTSPDFGILDVRDVDGDGDLDLVGGQGTNAVRWLERTGPGVTFALRTIVTPANGIGTISTPDLDGDGGSDVLWTSQTGDVVVWNRNGRGQVLLDLADQVPPGASNGQVFSILRVTVTHGGRVGDSDAELARLGLLFEEGPGDPLTTAEANALVEELRVHRDIDGNGTFDPGTDVLVATVPTLTGGVQTVTLPDGDPNLQVALGAPRSFFVVVQLTANASQQAPNQFRVTHLGIGPSATQAEDRSADFPLSTACPADVTTVMIGPVVPVELMRFTIE